MPSEQELAEFAAWKQAKEKQEIFGVLDEWAEKVGLTGFLATLADDDDKDEETKDLRDATEKAAAGTRTRAPKKEPDPEPESVVKSLASRLGLTGDSAA